MTIKNVKSIAALERAVEEGTQRDIYLDLVAQWTDLEDDEIHARMDELDRCTAMFRVHSLWLSRNGLKSDVVVRRLVNAPYAGSLVGLHLEENFFTNEHLSILCACDRFERLQGLHIQGNSFGNETLAALGASPFLENLVTLNLGVGWLGADGLRDLLGGAHELNLEHLGLGRNMIRIGDEGAKLIAESKALKNLRSLDLSNNDVGDNGLAALAHTMNFHLESLDLRNQEGVRYMDHESLARNHVGDEGVKALATSPMMKTLESLLLDGNPIEEEGVEALRSSPYLQKFKELDVLNIY